VFSWYAHQLPDILKKYGVVGTYFIEIFLPLLYYSPFREHRITASLLSIFLMIAIILTGNYNFFNFLTILLDLVVLDDKFILAWTPSFVWQMLGIKIPIEYLLEEEEAKK